MGHLDLPSRIVMAPLTRMRAGEGGVPTALNAHYYAQRAAAGLIITEATAISVQGHGYPRMPGIYTPQQIVGWRGVTDAVHERGGRIVLQIVHHGRWSHSSYNPDGSLPVAPSAIAPTGHAYTPSFVPVPYETPRALETAEIPAIIAAFRQAARNALSAGFDGVEVHGANGFLLDQFLQDGSNQRTDDYGGSIENRSRLLLEVMDEVAGAIGGQRVGVRLSPHGNLGGLSDSDPVRHFSSVIRELSRRNLAYLHLIEPRASSAGVADDASVDSANNAGLFRHLFAGPVISAGGYSAENGAATIEAGLADAIALGRMFIANPDLVARLRAGAPLNAFDRATAYGGDAHGYTDYPEFQFAVEMPSVTRRHFIGVAAVAAAALATAHPLLAASAKPPKTSPHIPKENIMNTFKTTDGTTLFYKDWGSGTPIVFSHGWPLSSDAWDRQMLFLGEQGYRVIAHDRRGHGRSEQTWNGNTMDTYADDLSTLIETLNLKGAILVGHSTGGGEVARYIGRHGTSRVAKAVLISAVPPHMAKSPTNPEGADMSIFDGIRSAVLADRADFFKDFAMPFYGFNRPGAKVSQGIIDSFWMQGMMAGIRPVFECIKQFSETDFSADLKKMTIPTLVMQGDEDQIVPIAIASLKTVKMVPNGTLKVYKGAPHGLCTTHADLVNADLLAFIKGA